MEREIINTLNGIENEVIIGRRSLKAIAKECRVFEQQTNDDEAKAVFARLSDCTSRQQFAAVFASL